MLLKLDSMTCLFRGFVAVVSMLAREASGEKDLILYALLMLWKGKATVAAFPKRFLNRALLPFFPVNI